MQLADGEIITVTGQVEASRTHAVLSATTSTGGQALVALTRDFSLGDRVLLNDTDVDADPLRAQLVTGPSNGQLELDFNGSFIYTPNDDFAGQDFFTYMAFDGQDLSNEATVFIDVTAVNDRPTIDNPGPQLRTENVPSTVLLTGITPGPGTAVDEANQPLTVIAVASDPTFFTGLTVGAVVNGEATLSYTPAADRNGPVDITVTVDDGQLENNTASETFTLTLAVELVRGENQQRSL